MVIDHSHDGIRALFPIAPVVISIAAAAFGMQQQHSIRRELSQLVGDLAGRQRKIKFTAITPHDRQPTHCQRLALRHCNPNRTDPITILKVVGNLRLWLIHAVRFNQLARAGSLFPALFFSFTRQIQLPILFTFMGSTRFRSLPRFYLLRFLFGSQRFAFFALVILLASIRVQFFSLI
ncbi:MAG TPA: hypothetical protein PL166_05400 [Candidatus Contendobacter sp.]|nr:hypothetical protein [Candidatus Contendobacter sp.]